MIDLGTVRPGSTIRIPFSSFDKDDGSSITMTNYAAADILAYKDGSTTERASTAGFTATTDFDGKTGKHVAVIDLADDTTADFWKAGSEYIVAIDAVTVDAVTTGGWIARFRIGYPNAYLDTSIATLASQTSFTLTAGPAEDDALNGMVLLVHDKASAVQVTRVVVEDYTGSTKTVTLRAAPAATFTIAAGDNVSAVGFDKVDLTHAGGVAASAWSATRGLAGTALPAAAAEAAGGLYTRGTGAGQINQNANGQVDVNAVGLSGDATAADNAEAFFDGTGYAGTGNVIPTVTTVTNLTNAPTNGDLTATMKTSVTTAATAATPTVTLAAAAVQAIWDALTSALTTVGSIGKWILDKLDVVVSTRASQTSVDDLPTNAELATSQAAADDATLAAIAALNNLSAAQVNAEVVDALRTDTGTEIAAGAVPAAAAPMGAQLQLLYQALRNKVNITATAKEVHTDAGAVVGTKTLSDDMVTYSETKMA